MLKKYLNQVKQRIQMAKKESQTSKKKVSGKEMSDLLLWAGICLGLGFGFLLGNLVAYLFLGIAVGLVAKFLWLRKQH